MSGNHIVNVALVGASGNSGSSMATELLKTGKHKITAITRQDSRSTFPDGINVARVDYDDEASLVQALKGQDALVITMSAMAPHDLQSKLVKAAAEANVPWILPNEWSPDGANEALVKDLAMLFKPKTETRELIEKLGKSSWIAVNTGFWYEWSLALPYAYGFDIANRSMTLLDGGNTPMTTSTWPQVGRAVASLLSLPIKSGEGACLENLRNTHIYISSFTLTQNDMLNSILRVTGAQKSDWTIKDSTADEYHRTGWEQFQKGDRTGMGRWMYGRVFGLDGVGNMEKNRETLNGVLGLPKEDVDQYTKIAVDKVMSGNNYTYST